MWLLPVALAETGVVDTAEPYSGEATLTESDVPASMGCVTVQIGPVPIDEPFVVTVKNGCEVTVHLQQPECAETTLASDFEGCARLEVLPGGADHEGLPFFGGDRTTVELEWLDPAEPGAVATATWSLDVLFDNSSYDTSPPEDSDSDLDTEPVPEDGRCGCSTGVFRVGWTLGLVGLLALGRRR